MTEDDGLKGTNEEKSREKKKRQKGTKRGLDLSPRAFIDNMVFSKTNTWAFYRIANNAYDFLDDVDKVQYGNALANALTGLFSERQSEPLDCYMISTSVPVDVSLWEEQIEEVTSAWKRSPGFADYVSEQAAFLRQKEYMRKVTYLGVDLGKRGAVDVSEVGATSAGLSGAWESVKKLGAQVFQVPGTEITEKEELSARREEKKFFTILSSGSMRAQRASTEELILLIKRSLWPAMPAPYLDVDHGNRAGAFDLELEWASAIRKRYRWLEITQQYGEHELTGYRATLSVSKLPKRFVFPQVPPFLYVPSRMGLPFTVYSRFQLVPNDKMRKSLYKKEQEQEDQLENMMEGGHSFDASTMEQMGDMEALKYQLTNDPRPWVNGSYRIVVETSTEDALKSFCSELKQTYSAMDINLNWTAGDQLDLFLEQMPGDRLRMGSFNQLTNMSMLGVTGMNISSDIGDPTYSDVDT